MVRDWLTTGMFAGAKKPGPKARADKVVAELGSHALTLSHARHIHFAKAREIRLNVTPLERDNAEQDAVLTVHHLSLQTMADTLAMKLIENQNGVAFVRSAAVAQQLVGVV